MSDSQTKELQVVPHCPVCSSDLGKDRVLCTNCRTPHHKECYTKPQDHKVGCGMYACNNTLYQRFVMDASGHVTDFEIIDAKTGLEQKVSSALVAVQQHLPTDRKTDLPVSSEHLSILVGWSQRFTELGTNGYHNDQVGWLFEYNSGVEWDSATGEGKVALDAAVEQTWQRLKKSLGERVETLQQKTIQKNTTYRSSWRSWIGLQTIGDPYYFQTPSDKEEFKQIEMERVQVWPSWKEKAMQCLGEYAPRINGKIMVLEKGVLMEPPAGFVRSTCSLYLDGDNVMGRVLESQFVYPCGQYKSGAQDDNK